MKTQGRKNVHGKGGVRTKAAYTTSKYKSMLRTLVTDLTIFSVLIYELVGPLLTKMALTKAGEIDPEGKVSERNIATQLPAENTVAEVSK